MMGDTLLHRGPDDGGVWCDPEAGVALVHRRLSILDLSSAGHQPMHSACARYVLAFNGEIYNFPELRADLLARGHTFRGHSDTEVLLASVRQWGLVGAASRSVGMFAFALWDREERKLSLCRDRMGEKPLYYGWCGATFLFGSELKALRVHPGWRGEIDRDALTLYLRHACVPSPYSIYSGIRKVPPGTIVVIDPDRPGEAADPTPYWRLRDAVEAGISRPFEGSDAEAAEALDQVLRDAVGRQMVADVPLGAFLSGGVDSSAIVALMQVQANRQVRTFSIGYEDEAYDEARYARRVAHHLGTDHSELYVTPEEAMAVIPAIPSLYDEPFADSSQIPTFLVSRLARESVTVSLSGDGGDELFGGYLRYLAGPRIWNKFDWLPLGARHTMGATLLRAQPGTVDSVYRRLEPLLPGGMRQRRPGEKLAKLGRVLSTDGPTGLYKSLVSSWENPEMLVRHGHEQATLLDRPEDMPPFRGVADRMMYLDAMTYLPDDILVKVDRAAMGVSLETRAPFLDHRVVEFAWRLPESMKTRKGVSKWLLRRVLDRYVPAHHFDRPKMGFAIPIDRWLRGPLRDWAEELLSERRLAEGGLLNPLPIRESWRDHLSGRAPREHQLWCILMFEAWKDAQKPGLAGAAA